MAADSKIGDVVAVACRGKEQFFLGRVYQERRQLDQAKGDVFGRFLKGDEVLEIRKLEPISHGSSRYTRTDKTFDVFAEDVRLSNVHLHEVAPEIPGGRVAVLAISKI